MTNKEFYSKLEELGLLTLDLKYLFDSIETKDLRYQHFKKLLNELTE